MVAIDLNSDLGESFGVWRLGDDEAMLEVVTSANVACGFHAGDPSTLRSVCTAAVHNGVAIGAQVSYPDLLGFGRRYIDIDPRDLRDAVLYQLGALDAFAQVAGAEVAYVKPHGALYHATIDGEAQAEAVVAAAAEYDPSLAVLGAPGSALLRCADAAGLEPVVEAFADRAYLRDGRLVPRSEPDALVVEPGEVAAAGRAPGDGARGRVGRRHRRQGPGPLALPPRRHTRRGRPGAGRARRARRGRRLAPRLHGMRVLPYGPEGGSSRCPSPTWSASSPRSSGATTPTSPSSCRPRARSSSGSARVPTAPAAAGGWPRSCPSDVGSTDQREVVEIAVRYDGEDLASVAAACGLSSAEVVDRHRATDYTCAFCGFAPGFAYLRGLDPALVLPRRATPRTRVPAGAVAIADTYTAVYPSVSPGGWHLIGSTDAPLWDATRRPPSLIRPGTIVRFVAR